MKTNLLSLAATLLLAASATSAFAEAQKVANSAVNVNGTWYYCGQYMDWCKGGSFNGADLGVLESLQLGGQSQAWDYNNNWESGQVQMSYKIDNGTVKVLYLDYWTHQYYNDSGETWMKFQSGTPATIDISGLAEGNHTLAVWFHCDYAYDSNNGQNFIANFITKPYKVANSSDISRVSNLSNGNPVAVQLDGLTLYKDSYWNSICLPFSLSQVEIETSPLAGAEICTLSGASLQNGTLFLEFATQTEITAGKPYFVKWGLGDAIVNPIFTGVKLSTNEASEVIYGDASFIGTFDLIEYETEDKNILFLGEENTLYYPIAGASIGAFHAYIELQENSPEGIKSFVLNFDDETTSITQINDEAKSQEANTYFTLDGRRLNDMPATAGLYIVNGKKVVIK